MTVDRAARLQRIYRKGLRYVQSIDGERRDDGYDFNFLLAKLDDAEAEVVRLRDVDAALQRVREARSCLGAADMDYEAFVDEVERIIGWDLHTDAIAGPRGAVPVPGQDDPDFDSLSGYGG